jgi:ribulose-phosphate 3-epimerase
MSVNPGFGGQKFIEHTYEKVKALKKIITDNGATTLIEIDGGVTENNAAKLVAAGADVLVAGTTVFKAADPKQMIATLKDIK